MVTLVKAANSHGVRNTDKRTAPAPNSRQTLQFSLWYHRIWNNLLECKVELVKHKRAYKHLLAFWMAVWWDHIYTALIHSLWTSAFWSKNSYTSQRNHNLSSEIVCILCISTSVTKQVILSGAVRNHNKQSHPIPLTEISPNPRLYVFRANSALHPKLGTLVAMKYWMISLEHCLTASGWWGFIYREQQTNHKILPDYPPLSQAHGIWQGICLRIKLLVVFLL